jgi:hypothetical protein
MEKRIDSSVFTFIYKFMFPFISVCMFILMTITFFYLTKLPFLSKIAASLCFLIIASFFCFFGAPLKRIFIAKDHLLISNYFKTIRTSFSEVDHISEATAIYPNTATIHFKTDTKFGRKIVFMPKLSFRTYGYHPDVKELQELVASSQSQNT